MLWITIRVYVYRGMVYTSFSGQALSKNVSNTITTLGNYGAGRQCSNCSLYLHGGVNVLHECVTSITLSCSLCSTCRLGEACSHIAALLSCVVQAVVARQSSGSYSCTSQKCVWLPPAKNVIDMLVTCDV